MSIFSKQHGMNIVGQGGKIILFMLPSLAAAIAVHKFNPGVLPCQQGWLFSNPLVMRFCFSVSSSGRRPFSSC